MANLVGTNSADVIDASDGVTNGSDTIAGYAGADVIYGLGGNDLIKGGGGADAIYGGSGIDTAAYVDSDEAVIVSLETNTGVGGTAEGDTLSSIENLTGSAHADILVGNGAANVLSGGAEADTLKGGGGADTLDGDDGADVLRGGSGADILNGGVGLDTASYSDSSAAVQVSLLWGTASGGDAQGDTLNGIENLTGSAYADTLAGDAAANVLRGNAGNDSLSAYGGDDTLFGDDGDDMLDGGVGADEMFGGNGKDTFVVDNAGDVVHDTSVGTFDTVVTSVSYVLTAGADIELFETTLQYLVKDIALTGNEFSQKIRGNAGANAINGGDGNDTLWGLAGDDAFVFSTPLGASNVDVIADYALNDLIALDDAVFGGLSTTFDGHLAAGNFAIGAAAADADDRIVYDNATGALFYDADGNGAGAAIQFAKLGTGLALNSDEFLVV